MRTRITVLLSLGWTLVCAAQEIGYVETFALADDRDAALKELVPGTDDFYFYYALQAQNAGARAGFQEIMNRWIRARDGSVTPRARELLNRQSLLDYDKDPAQTLAYLTHEQGLTFAHARRTGERQSNAPSSFDNAPLSRDALLRTALSDPRSLSQVSDEGLAFVASANLTGEQRRHLLSRLTRPDLPGLVDLIVADLQFRDSRGFGHHPVHALLTLAQLDQLAQKKPELVNEAAFVDAYLAKLAPEDEIDLDTDEAAREAYFDRVWAFVSKLAPAHNSLKANVLYSRLRHDLRKGVLDRERFMAYIKLPRNVQTLRPEYREQVQRGNEFAQLNRDFNLIGMPPIPVEEPLVRRLLLECFKADADWSAFAPYLRDDFLKPLFAEAKIVNGIGDPQQWSTLLAPEAYQALKERVDIDFAETNPDVFGAHDAVKLTAFVKNVPSLLLKIYEINTFNYYRDSGQPLNLAVNLDGLVASVSRRVTFADPSERRAARAFDLPEITSRGAFVVELIGNGKSSRALVQKGRLEVLQDITPAGHAFSVFDEDGKRLRDIAGWLGGRAFEADADGRVLVPFSTAPQRERIVISQGGFSTLVAFDHAPESYSLKAGIYVDREALIRREKALIAVRPVLLCGGKPASLKLLEEIRLTVRAVDLQGIATEKEFPLAALREDAETVQEIQVPESAVSMRVTLRARVQNLSQNSKQDLSDDSTFALNEIDRTPQTQVLYPGRDAEGYFVDLRGKNGEPLPDEPVRAWIRHRFFATARIAAELKTDKSGRVRFGPLEGVASVRLRAAIGATCDWSPLRDACAYPEGLQGAAGDVLRVPYVGTAADAASAASLLETRKGQFIKEWADGLSLKGGFLELSGLPAGDYQLHMKAEDRTIAVRITQGDTRDGFVISPRRALERPRLAPLTVTSVTAERDAVRIRLANVTPYARVHLIATRYLPSYDLFARLGDPCAPAPVQQTWQPVRTFYESGRDIGDEYRYVLDRQQARKYPGNMLERPGLLLNPWALRTTDAQAERLAEGRDFAGRASSVAQAATAVAGARFEDTMQSAEGFATFDFLKQPAVTLLNLVPDQEGSVEVPLATLKGLPFLRVLAVDPTATVLKCAALANSPVDTRELRLAPGLSPQKNFTEQKRVTPVQAKGSVTVEDVTTSRFETYDTVAKVYRLLSTLNADATFAEFGFVSKWSELDPAEQRRLYAKYACHELSFFLFHKDRPFFDAVIAPYLKNKKDKTFLDHWLLGDGLAGYLEPWRFGRLNAVERVLLGKRLREQEASVVRDTRERSDLLPPDMEAFNRRFDTAVQTGALEADASAIALGIDNVRSGRADEAKKELAKFALAAPAEAAPTPAAPALGAASPVILKGTTQAMRQRAMAKKPEMKGKKQSESLLFDQDDIAVSLAETVEDEAQFFDARRKDRESSRRFFQKLDKTQEWAENNYWHLPIERQIADLVTVNAFWADYASHDGKSSFLSRAFPDATTSFTEMMLALAVLDVPFKAAPHTEALDGLRYTLQAGSPLILFHCEIGEAKPADAPGSVLVAQHFFRADDRERFENNERFDKPVTEEFLPHVVYGAQVVLTNPTGNRQKLHVLLQIPSGAMPVSGGFHTRGFYVVLEPYSTSQQEYFFYFPSTGNFPHYPVTLASLDRVVARAEPFTFHVVEKLSKVDTTSWAWISQNGTEAETLAFLNGANLYRLNLEDIAWRMKSEPFFRKATALLQARHVYDDTLWSYGIQHNVPGIIREYLRHTSFADHCGPWLTSTLLTLEPVERFAYQHLEYAPLVNPRAHPVGARRTILNAAFRDQYRRFMNVLCYKPKLSAADTLAAAYYLALQDRVDEALAWFARVDRKAIAEQLQADYLEAYLDLYKGDTDAARRIAQSHAAEGVDRWRNRFAQLSAQLDEIAGGTAGVSDQESRDQAQGALAATEPVLEMQVEAGRIRLDTRNLAACTLNFYPMDIELLFSRSPFLQEGAAQFSYIRPALSRTVAIAAGQNGASLELPEEFKTRNVMVEALGGGVRKTQAYYANSLKVQMIESYGQLIVTRADSGKAVPGTYVKVYARTADGKVKFFKDGYTDLRGRFDYASLNTNEIENAERLAVLILSDAFGAVVREAPPPKR